ncbi:DapH/DapD/GlmU-related protein [Rapidithrix thailandica]|uniref:DapH/DapD/GlmU-related protein n=1 Tax=Rapidithrix thailandica TaxID=413964 RepID=A0AAW9SCF5_9BACT
MIKKHLDIVTYFSIIKNKVLSPLIKGYLINFCGITIGKHARFYGMPILLARNNGKIIIGDNFKANSNSIANPVGISHPLIITATGDIAKVYIGNNVGISGASITCKTKITIGDNVLIGGGVAIWDTDFHPVDAEQRIQEPNAGKTAPISIEDNVFIGARAIILKGVSIGVNSVIAAGTIVNKSIPPNCIAYGNPMLIKNLK